MKRAILIAFTVLLCSNQSLALTGAAVGKRSPMPHKAREARLLRGMAGAHTRHLAQLPPLPSPQPLGTATASATATATASSNASGDTGDYPSFGECQTAAVAFATAGTSPTGRRLLTTFSSSSRSLSSLQDYFHNAVAAANAAGAAFGSPAWQNAFIASCASQATSSAGGGGRKMHTTRLK